MVDFVKSFQQGLTLADIARKNKAEIRSVFDELNTQLNPVTEGKIQIELMSYELEKNPVAKPSKGSIRAALSTWHQQDDAITGESPHNIYDTIGARNLLVKNSPPKELAKWSQNPRGYPCTITIGKTEYVCENKEALERTLATMLQHPSVGEILQTLL